MLLYRLISWSKEYVSYKMSKSGVRKIAGSKVRACKVPLITPQAYLPKTLNLKLKSAH